MREGMKVYCACDALEIGTRHRAWIIGGGAVVLYTRVLLVRREQTHICRLALEATLRERNRPLN